MTSRPLVCSIGLKPDLTELVAWAAEQIGAEVLDRHSLAEVAAEQTSLASCWIVELDASPAGLLVEQELRVTPIDRPLIVVTTPDRFATAIDAMRRGALDCLTRPIVAADFLDRLRAALQLDAQAQAYRQRQSAVASDLETLTSREREVLGLMAEGYVTKQIARRLGISPKTVEVHRSNILRKMHAGSSAQMYFLMAQAGGAAGFPGAGLAPCAPRESSPALAQLWPRSAMASAHATL